MTPPRTPAEMREHRNVCPYCGTAYTVTEFPVAEDPEREALLAVAKAAEEYRGTCTSGTECECAAGLALDAALARLAEVRRG